MKPCWGSSRPKLVMPGLRSAYATVRLPLLLCVAVVLLLLFNSQQLRGLQTELQKWRTDIAQSRARSGYDVDETLSRGPLGQDRGAVEHVPFKAELIGAKPPAGQAPPAPPVHPGPPRTLAPPLPLPQAQVAPGGQKQEAGPAPVGAWPAPKEAGPGHKGAGPVAGGQLSDGEVAALTQVLEMRLQDAGRSQWGTVGLRDCAVLAAANNTRGACRDTRCSHRFHPSPEARVQQLVTPPHMQVTSAQRRVMEAIARDVPPRKFIFVTAASSNHYNESQALVHNLRQFVFPRLPKDSYSFYYFDLGLSAVERRRTAKNCNCSVKTFPVRALPPHARHLMCYTWKPVIIRALIEKAQVIVYMDVSIRWRADLDWEVFFATARRWGAQFLATMDAIPNHTVEQTFHFYGDEPCTYWPYPELLAGFSVFHNEVFMKRVVLDPWVACAFNATCMCPVDPHGFRLCAHKERRVGQCHRFDLSSLTVMMAKLYGETFGHLVLRTNNPPSVRRDHKMAFFTD